MRTSFVALVLIGLAAPVPRVSSQVATPPEFEVVSVKPRTGPLQPTGPQSPWRYTSQDTTLRNLIAFAYELSFGRIAGGPEWLSTSRFAVDAVAKGTPTVPETRRLVQSLLADRFQLRSHMERRELPVFMLRVAREDGRPGQGMKPVADDYCESVPRPGGEGSERLEDRCDLLSVGVGEIRSRGVTMAQFVRNLSSLPAMTGVDRVVLDATGLAGRFDLLLQFRPPSDRFAPAVDSFPERNVALAEQLGLKLDAERALVDVLVVDAAAYPGPD